ncbi:MAG: hypothetical protein WDZ49_07820 [Litorilinea sp.]
MSTVPVPRTNYLILTIVVVCVLLIAGERLLALPVLRSLTNGLWQWVIILAACAMLLGVFNVLVVHARRVLAGSRSWANSLILVATALAVFVMGSIGPGGSRGAFAEWIFGAILAPGMATLFALLAFFMVAAAYRYLRIGGLSSAPLGGATGATAIQASATQGGGWMLSGALLFLLLQTPMLNAILPPAVVGFAGWVLDVPAMATLRGVLLGGSIALLLMGIRLVVRGN